MSERPNTVRVRIAVAVSPNGCWSSDGGRLGVSYQQSGDEDMSRAAACWLFQNHPRGHVVFIEADVPMPAPALVVEGTVMS